MTKISDAFNNLLDVIEEETSRKFKELEEKVKAKRIEQLEKDLAELDNRKAAKKHEDFKEFNTTKG